MMKIVYTKHLKVRIEARKIPYELPRRIIKTSQERYQNIETGHKVAVGKAKYAGKLRLMLVVYDTMIQLTKVNLRLLLSTRSSVQP